MRRTILLFAALAFCATAAHAQSLDDFGGLLSASCPTTNQQQAATLSQTGTTLTAIVTNGSAYAVGEYIRVFSTGTSMDTVFNGATNSAGAAQVTNIASNTLTLTSPISATVGSTAGNIALDYFYMSSGISTPWGTRSGLCTPEGHWFFAKLLSNAAAGPSAGEKLHFSFTPTSNTATGGVVTMAFTNTWVTLGMRVVIASCADTNYNGTFQITAASSTDVSYADTLAGASTTECVLTPYQWDQFKYNGGSSVGVACAAAMGQMNRAIAVGFNGPGDDSDSQWFSYQGCTPYTGGKYTPGFTPVTTPSVTRYAQANLWGCGPQGMKDPEYATIATLKGLVESDMDWFDPNWPNFISCAFAGTTHNPAGYFNSPFLIGMTVDDSDNMGQTRSGPWWHPSSGGSNVTTVLPSLWVMYAPPQITLSDKSIYSSGETKLPNLYPNSALFSKVLSGSAPSGCWADASGTTSPGGNPVGPAFGFCSLPDWLRNRYGTIANLNTAWSSTYTTFGSTQSSFTGESHALADTALGHSNVTPRSLALYLTPSGGSAIMVAGDCQVGATDCPTGTAGNGTLMAPGSCLNGSNANFYQNAGIVCVDSNSDIEEVTTSGQEGSTTVTWPATSSCSGTQTTTNGTVVFTCIGPNVSGTLTYSSGAITLTAGGAGSLPSGETLSANYTTGGWDAGGTGLLDEHGASGWVTTNGVCLAAPPHWQASTAYTAYADSSVISFQVAEANYWAIALTSGTTGSGADPTGSWPTTNGATETSGTVTFGILGVPVSDASNGLEFKTACGANAAFAADMNNWLETYIGKYLSTVQTAFKTINPAMLNFGVNFGANDYGDPTWSQVLKVEQLFTDGGFWGEYMDGSQGSLDPQEVWKQNYAFTYFQKPVMIEEFEVSQSGWETLGGSATCVPNGSTWATTYLNCWTTPVTRNQGFYSQLQDELQYRAPNGNAYYTGITWWSDHCGNAATANSTGCLGLWDNDDNRLDGIEDVTSSVFCSIPLGTLSCGGELSTAPWLGMNAETCTQCLVPALALPYNLTLKNTAIPRTWVFR